jgi:zinc D-Ala-D-Ala dipeptidase
LDNPDDNSQQYHFNRQLLNRTMSNAGFMRHPDEWWHFSLGDQMWAWLRNQNSLTEQAIARYGRI